MVKKIILILAPVIIICLLIALNKIALDQKTTKPVAGEITINGKNILVELADTPEARARGLSGRPDLMAGHGLLFIFDKPGQYGFWMKEMNFPIDIIWLDANYQIIDTWLNAQPASYPASYQPKNKAIYVLETNPGEIPNL